MEIGLQGEEGYPHKGHLDYASPQVDFATGTLTARALFDNKDARCCRACSCGCARRLRSGTKALLTRNDAIGTSQEGSYVLVVGARQRRRKAGRHAGVREGRLRVIKSGLKPRRLGGDRGRSARLSGREGRSAAGQMASAAPVSSPEKAASDSAMSSESRAGAISRFFIERPVLANVLALVFVLVGLVALFNLPSSQYPNVVPPTVQVTTRYPGASAMTLVDTVALPIEQNVNGVENMIYMQSTNASDGTYSLIVTFAIGTDPDEDEILVQNRVSAARFVVSARSAAPGRDDEEEVDVDPRVCRS